MKPLKTLSATIKSIPGLDLHILLTEEDGVIVARCLDFSVSSHGENEEDALASLNDSIKDYLDYALQQEAYQDIIDSDEEEFWNLYRKQKLLEESVSIKRNAELLKNIYRISEVCYA